MFDEIYKIAIESNDFEELERKLKTLYIDALTMKDGFPATTGTQLASEGENNKVEWMRQLGANVNDIAQGYALADNQGQVELYRTKHKASVNSIAQGYALADNHEQVEFYRKEHDADVNAIALGYALIGNHERVEFYRTEHGASADSIAQGYALANNSERVEAYRTEHGASVDFIAQGYALANNHEQVEAYHTELGANVNIIALGYALAGNHEEVEFYRTEHRASVDSIALGYALANNHERVEAYRTEHGANIDCIALGYTLTGNHEKQKKYDINYLLDSYLKERTAVKASCEVSKKYFHLNFFSASQEMLNQEINAVNALKSVLEGNYVDLSEHLSILSNGPLGEELGAFVNLGMGNDLVGKEMTTVCDFLQALQDKVANKIQTPP